MTPEHLLNIIWIVGGFLTILAFAGTGWAAVLSYRMKQVGDQGKKIEALKEDLAAHKLEEAVASRVDLEKTLLTIQGPLDKMEFHLGERINGLNTKVTDGLKDLGVRVDDLVKRVRSQ